MKFEKKRDGTLLTFKHFHRQTAYIYVRNFYTTICERLVLFAAKKNVRSFLFGNDSNVGRQSRSAIIITIVHYRCSCARKTHSFAALTVITVFPTKAAAAGWSERGKYRACTALGRTADRLKLLLLLLLFATHLARAFRRILAVLRTPRGDVTRSRQWIQPNGNNICRYCCNARSSCWRAASNFSRKCEPEQCARIGTAASAQRERFGETQLTSEFDRRTLSPVMRTRGRLVPQARHSSAGNGSEIFISGENYFEENLREKSKLSSSVS